MNWLRKNHVNRYGVDCLAENKPLFWRHIDLWNEDYGMSIWTKLPTDEPYYIGTPLCSDWIDGYYDHFMPATDFQNLIDFDKSVKNI